MLHSGSLQDVQHAPPPRLHGAVLTGGTTSVTTAVSPSQRGEAHAVPHIGPFPASQS